MYEAKKLKCHPFIRRSVSLCFNMCVTQEESKSIFLRKKTSFYTPYKNISILTETRIVSCLLFLSTCLKAISWLLSLTNPIHSAL